MSFLALTQLDKATTRSSLLVCVLVYGAARIRSFRHIRTYIVSIHRFLSQTERKDRERFRCFFFLFLYWAICVAPIRQITYETASINLDRGHQSRTESSRCTAFVTKRSILLIGNSEFLSSSRIEMSKWCKNFASPKYGSNRCICNE